MNRVIRNRARCKVCGDIVESMYTHDYRSCCCGNLHVDGGHDYARRVCRGGEDSYEELSQFYEYDWDEGSVSSDGHVWFVGVDLLKCARTATGETVTLPIFLPYVKLPELVECTVYSIDTALFVPNPPVKHVYIALHEFKHSTILFRDEETFLPLFRHIKDCILAAEQTG